MVREKLVEQLKRHEGFQAQCYRCTAGKMTIGYGRNLDDVGFRDGELQRIGIDPSTPFDKLRLDEWQAEVLLRNDAYMAQKKAQEILGVETWQAMTEPQQDAVTNMVFNLGPLGFRRFKSMITALHSGNYIQAAVEMLDSRWAKQVKSRAMELAEQMASGAYGQGRG